LSKISFSPRCFLDDDLGAHCSSFTFKSINPSSTFPCAIPGTHPSSLHPMCHGSREKHVERDTVSADQKAAFRLEGCSKCGAA